MSKPFLQGVKASLPVCLGVIPVGISYGLAATQAGLSAPEGILMSILVMAGSAQLTAVGMLAQGAPAAAIVFTTFFINLRHIVMSSSVMNQLRNTSIPKKLAGAFALCDESFAIFSLSEAPDYGLLVGANTVLYGTWVTSSAIGCFITRYLPEILVDSFGIAFYAAFLAMLIPRIKENRNLLLLVILTAAIHSALRLALPASWAVVLSIILGAAAGVPFVEG